MRAGGRGGGRGRRLQPGGWEDTSGAGLAQGGAAARAGQRGLQQGAASVRQESGSGGTINRELLLLGLGSERWELPTGRPGWGGKGAAPDGGMG